MMAERFPFVDIRNMHLNDGLFHPRNRVANRHRSVRKTARVENDAQIIGIKTNFVDFVNQRAFPIALKIQEFDLRKIGGQNFQIVLKSLVAINFWLAATQQIEFWAF